MQQVNEICKKIHTKAVIGVRSKDELGLFGAEIARYPGVNTSIINRALARAEGAEGQ